MLNVVRFLEGSPEYFDAVDPAWLKQPNGVLWVDLSDPSPDETKVLSEVFKFHELAIEDALATLHFPKIEAYDGYLYLILHGIDFEAGRHRFATHDTDFFIGANYLVTVHHGGTRSIPYVRELCLKGAHIMQEGPFALAHRIIDKMIDNYRPEVEKFEEQLDRLESLVFEKPDPMLMREILDLKRDVASLRRVVMPERDVVGRLARREFPEISEMLAYRFRDVHDHLVRMTDEALYFQDRISGLLDAHLSSASHRLNEVMKVLTLISTIFMPMTVVAGIYGMNVELPVLPGGSHAQFYWVMAMLFASTAAMLWFFRTRKWW